MGSLINDVYRLQNANNQAQAAVAKTPTEPKPAIVPTGDTKNINRPNFKDEFLKQHRKNGLIERFYNFLKNSTNFGTGSKKVLESIKLNEEGKRTDEQVKSDIQKYRISQKTSQQLLGDTLSAIAGMSVYSAINNNIKKEVALRKTGGSFIKFLLESKTDNKKIDAIINNLQEISPTKRIGVAVGAAIFTGMFVKKLAMSINRIGSKEFKSQKKKSEQTKQERKLERKQLRKAKRKEGFKNIATGALNGALAPLIGVAGGIVGIPAFFAINLATRYLSSQKGDDKASLKDFAQKFKDNAVLNSAFIALTALPLAKKASYNKVLTENLNKVVSKLKKTNLSQPYKEHKTAYQQLEESLLKSDNINNILSDPLLPVAEQIKQLTKENIFAVKFIQISDHFGLLSTTLRENCPSSRTIEQAKDIIAKTYGNRFQLSKQLGVGTIAETYLAKDAETGKEVCIKILKDGITAAKIDADKQKMINIIKSTVKNQKEQEYLIKNTEDLASGIRKEVDFANEMESAQKLAKITKEAFVVKPMEVKDNIYVMEKANGISLKTLEDVVYLEAEKKNIVAYDKKYGKTTNIERLKDIDEKIEEIKKKSPDFAELNITHEEINKILSNYIKVVTEQFDSIYKNGKTLHADIHPGNVFVDIKALKEGKNKVITLIDTGNTVDITMEQSKTALKLSQYIKNGNIKDLSSYIMEGAILPDGMTKKQSIEIMESELKKMFFDTKTKINYMNNNEFFILTSNIMREHNIIPSTTQLNLEKAKHSAMKSANAVIESLMESKYAGITELSPLVLIKISSDVTSWMRRLIVAKKMQDVKNLSQFSLSEVIKNRHNPNMLKTNSEEHLIYQFKQNLENTDISNVIPEIYK